MLVKPERTEVVRVSELIETCALGGIGQPKYLNAVAEIKTVLSAKELLRKIEAIEAALGRVRNLKWAPRTIDLDILLYGDLVYSDPQLQIPHSQMSTRRFVLRPLTELCPQVVLPRSGYATVSELLTNCPDTTTVQFFSSPPEVQQTKSRGLP